MGSGGWAARSIGVKRKKKEKSSSLLVMSVAVVGTVLSRDNRSDLVDKIDSPQQSTGGGGRNMRFLSPVTVKPTPDTKFQPGTGRKSGSLLKDP